MNFLKKYFSNRRFAKYDLKVIKDIDKDRAFIIAEQLVQTGWELSREYSSVAEWPSSQGQCKLRKGQSTIEFEWKQNKANIIAPTRILKSIALDNDVEMYDTLF